MSQSGDPTDTTPSPAPAMDAALLDQLILPIVRDQMRRVIAGVNDVEVYFIARLNAELVIEEAEAFAFGNKHSVPARGLGTGSDIIFTSSPPILEIPSRAFFFSPLHFMVREGSLRPAPGIDNIRLFFV